MFLSESGMSFDFDVVYDRSVTGRTKWDKYRGKILSRIIFFMKENLFLLRVLIKDLDKTGNLQVEKSFSVV